VRRADDWRIAMRICFEEMCGFLASEPAFASLRTVDIYGAGPEHAQSVFRSIPAPGSLAAPGIQHIYPRPASISAIPRPMPGDAPVTMTTF